jgi:hypothetical protein
MWNGVTGPWWKVSSIGHREAKSVVKSSMGSEIVYQACVSMQRKATGKVSVGNKI